MFRVFKAEGSIILGALFSTGTEGRGSDELY